MRDRMMVTLTVMDGTERERGLLLRYVPCQAVLGQLGE